MEIEEKKHNHKVEELKKVLADCNLPTLPLTTIHNEFYQADIVTRIDTRFIPIDYINSRGQVAFDIGGLTMLSRRDICDFALAIIDDVLWEKYLHGFRQLKLDLMPKVTMIPAKEVRSYLEQFHSKLHYAAHPSLVSIKPN